MSIDLASLSKEELTALKADLQLLINQCATDESDKNNEISQATSSLQNLQASYDLLEESSYLPPTVVGETVVYGVGNGPAVVEHIAVDIPVQLQTFTGNGDDGIGLVFDWSEFIGVNFKFNTLIEVGGQKLSGEGQILEVDYIGAIADSREDIIVSGVEVLIDDLFDPNAERLPDKTFTVGVFAKPANETFRISVSAPQPTDPPLLVTVGPLEPVEIHQVQVIETFAVESSEIAFVVEVGPKDLQPENIFNVITAAKLPHRAYSVSVGAKPFDQEFKVLTGETFDVSTSWAPPLRTFDVDVYNFVIPEPVEVFGVTVSGDPDQPNEIFNMSVSWPVPDRIFKVTAIDTISVDVATRLGIEVGPVEQGVTVFDVTAANLPYDEKFEIEVGISENYAEEFSISVVSRVFEVFTARPPIAWNVNEAQPTTGEYRYRLSRVGGDGSTSILPDLYVRPRQTLTLNVNAPNNPLWIKQSLGTGSGEVEPAWATITGNGVTQGQLEVSFNEVGNYFYQSELEPDNYGQIFVLPS